MAAFAAQFAHYQPWMPEARELPTIDLPDYEIIGEISGRTDARAFMARRKSDGAEVVITVAAQPAGDEGNALNHLAADTNLLKGRGHRSLLPVLDGHWINDAFAVVFARPDGPSLEELLARREEMFDYPRIALVLQELNGLLEWARDQKVVHRALGTDSIFLEPGSDRVWAAFEVRPLPIADMPGPEEDARTIARLARSMLTRSDADPEREHQPLEELRPGLPTSVIEQTLQLLEGSGTESPDVRGYIAAIAMSDALKRGETECANTMAQLREEERVTREKLQAEKDAAIRAAEEQEEAFSKERAAILRDQEKERAAMQRERETMLAELAKDRQSLIKVRDALERERSELAKKAGELKAQRVLYEKTEEFMTPAAALPAIPDIEPAPPRWHRTLFRKRHSMRPLLVVASAAALIVVVALAAVSRRPGRPPATLAGPAAQLDSAAGVSAASVDSASPATVPDTSATLGTPGLPLDLVSGVANRAAFEPAPVVRRPRPRPRRVDTLAVRPDSIVRDSILEGIRRDSIGRAALRDSIRRDSIRRDSIRRDTVRRDTMPRT